MAGRFEYKNLVAGVYIAAMFMQIMDGTIINVALPTLAEEFGVDAPSMDWTVLSFTIALGVMTASAGWFGGRFGLKNIFLVALAGFVGASLLCGLSQSLNQLVAARALQGGFAGMITPAGSALLFNAFPIEERSVASRKVITVAVIAPALGPIVGGAILEVLPWYWIFLVNLPIGGIALVLAWRWLRSDEPVGSGTFDISGFVLLAVGLGLGLYGLSRGGERGWGSAPILISLIAGVAFLALLVRSQLRSDAPILHLRLLTERLFRICNILAFPIYAGFMSLLYLLPLFLQAEGGHSPLSVGLALFPQALGVLVMSQFVGRSLYKQVGPKRLLLSGSVLGLLVGLAIATIDVDTSLWTVRLLMFLRGSAMGLLFVPMQSAVYAKIEPRQMSQATPLYGTSRQVAPALGIAIASTVLTTGLRGDAVDAASRVTAYQWAMVASALMFGFGVIASLFVKDGDAAATLAPART